ncbi:MAG: hypothetical protein NT086_19825 [Proteobacteria bacterium]|nr:hypothetical protein [Pseudomonadota bacterium]
MELPQTGGAYTRDPVTGELTQVSQPQPAPAGFFTPAETEVNSAIKETADLRKA